jgi:hypothetical protein
MAKVVSEDSARKAIKRMNPHDSEQWMQKHLLDCCEPLLNIPWILDVDTTIKPLYSHQEKADIGYLHTPYCKTPFGHGLSADPLSGGVA